MINASQFKLRVENIVNRFLDQPNSSPPCVVYLQRYPPSMTMSACTPKISVYDVCFGVYYGSTYASGVGGSV